MKANTSREQICLKRRIYDALNVLKSAKVIQKCGKIVKWNVHMPSPRIGNVLTSRDDRPNIYIKNSIVEKRIYL